MRKLLIVAALACAPVLAVTLNNGRLQLNEREQKVMPNCEALGGCEIVSQAELMQFVQRLRQQWEAEITESFEAAVKQEAKKVCQNTV